MIFGTLHESTVANIGKILLEYMAQNRLLWTRSDQGAIDTHPYGRLVENGQIADSGTYADDPDSGVQRSSEGAADDGEINGEHGNYTTVRISSLHP